MCRANKNNDRGMQQSLQHPEMVRSNRQPLPAKLRSISMSMSFSSCVINVHTYISTRLAGSRFSFSIQWRRDVQCFPSVRGVRAHHMRARGSPVCGTDGRKNDIIIFRIGRGAVSVWTEVHRFFFPASHPLSACCWEKAPAKAHGLAQSCPVRHMTGLYATLQSCTHRRVGFAPTRFRPEAFPSPLAQQRAKLSLWMTILGFVEPHLFCRPVLFLLCTGPRLWWFAIEVNPQEDPMRAVTWDAKRH